MDSLPPVLLEFISVFGPFMRAEVFDSFTYLLCGLLIGEAKHGTGRASVFAPTVLTTATLVGFILPAQALATRPDGAVDREGLDYPRAKRVIGRAKHLQGHCYVFAAHLYQPAQK